MKTKSTKTIFEGYYVKGKRPKKLKQPWTNEKLEHDWPSTAFVEPIFGYPKPKKKKKKTINTPIVIININL